MITVFRGVTSVSAKTGKVAGSEANVCYLDFSGQDVGDMEGVCFSGWAGTGGGIGEEWVCYSWIPHGLRVTRDSISTGAASHFSGWT